MTREPQTMYVVEEPDGGWLTRTIQFEPELSKSSAVLGITGIKTWSEFLKRGYVCRRVTVTAGETV